VSQKDDSMADQNESLSDTDENLSEEEQQLLNRDKYHKPFGTLLLAAVILFGGFWFYSEINAVEQAGGESVSLPRPLALAYDFAGKLGVTGACILGGMAFLVGGIVELVKGPPSQRPRS
jgi:hypothetical protein